MSSMYELMVVATTGGAESLISRVEKLVKDAEASDVKLDKLGKKQLAYPIKKQTEAQFFVFNFSAEGANLKSITDKLRLEQEDVLRYMLLSTKPFKPSKRKNKKTEEVKVEEKKETPKVTVVTKKVSGSADANLSKKPASAKAPKGKVDAKAKSKVASKAKKGKSKK